jgi:UDP-glucose 4-epimerase
LQGILGKQLEVQYLPPRAGDVKHSMASIEAAERDLGYRVLVDFEEGLRRTVKWHHASINASV